MRRSGRGPSVVGLRSGATVAEIDEPASPSVAAMPVAVTRRSAPPSGEISDGDCAVDPAPGVVASVACTSASAAELDSAGAAAAAGASSGLATERSARAGASSERCAPARAPPAAEAAAETVDDGAD
jgi:hypothetical protein